MAKKYVYYFGDGKAEGTSNMKELLGGKGAGLAEMTNLGISVPPGFTISTEACVEYYKQGKKFPSGMWEASLQALKRVERSMGMGFGNPERPLLVSVRSGARASMPGMMDTVLNVGLTTKTVEGLAAKTRNDRFAQDSYRRFVSMYGSIVMGVPREHFEAILKHKKTEVGVAHETHLDARHLRELVSSFKALVKEETKKEFPDEPLDQLRLAINAVFSSWFGARAITYRRLYGIPDSWGTAVNVVAMVFGNMGETSGTGVAFTRSPSSGDKAFFGECLMNAQGEDVVAGIRTPLPVSALAKNVPEAYKDLEYTYKKLEKHYRDMLDLEFTIQEGKLYMLQTRVGKRTGIAAVKIAVDMVKEGHLEGRSGSAHRTGSTRAVSLSDFRYERRVESESARQGPAGRTRSGGRENCADAGSRGGHESGGHSRGIGPAGNQSGRHSWNECGGGVFDGARRHDVACRGCGASDGQGLRGRLRIRGSPRQPKRENRRARSSVRATISPSMVRPGMSMKATFRSLNLKSFK